MSDSRIERLGVIAGAIRNKPVAEQFRILGAEGLTLTDVNWENCNTAPDSTAVIPLEGVKPEPQAEGKP